MFGMAHIAIAGPTAVLGSQATGCTNVFFVMNRKGVKAALQRRGGHYMIEEASRREGILSTLPLAMSKSKVVSKKVFAAPPLRKVVHCHS